MFVTRSGEIATISWTYEANLSDRTLNMVFQTATFTAKNIGIKVANVVDVVVPLWFYVMKLYHVKQDRYNKPVIHNFLKDPLMQTKIHQQKNKWFHKFVMPSDRTAGS